MYRAMQTARLLWLAAVFAATFTAGCANTPIGVAETLEQRAYAAYGSFVIAEENVEELTRADSSLGDSAKLSLIQATQRAQPVVDGALAALEEYQAARAEFEAGRQSEGVFNAVVAKLGDWVTRAEDLVGALLGALRSVR